MPADLIKLYFWLQLIADLILVGFGIYHEIVLERMKSEIDRLRKVTINLDLDRVAVEDKIGKIQKNYKRIRKHCNRCTDKPRDKEETEQVSRSC